MKHQYFLLGVLVILAVGSYGCAAFVASPVIGGLLTDVTAPITYDPGATGQPYQVLGVVEGRSTATSVLGLVASGDASVDAAYHNALLKIPGAEELIDVTVDYQAKSILGLYASYTTIVRGKAIKRTQ